MSYAIESKKRKFGRILESLTESKTTQTRSVLNPYQNVSNNTIHPSFGSNSSKRRRITPIGGLTGTVNTSTASLTAHYLPSSRLAFLERLESFRQVVKWHIPSTSPINAVEWAKRGWVCQDTDTVSCPSCKERVHVDIELDKVGSTDDASGREEPEQGEGDEDPIALSNAILNNLLKRYQEMIVGAHTEACPWKKRGCDQSIQRIEGLLNMSTALLNLQTRYQSMIGHESPTPEVAPLPSIDTCKVDEQEYSKFKLEGPATVSDLNTLKLAICGWQKKDTDIVECRHCFRSLGLWLYRGAQPTIEHLDAIDSHLEYCPWRSALPQDTELSINVDGQPTKQKVPGWVLVHIAIVKKNHKGEPQGAVHRPDEIQSDDAQPQLTPEQREKKTKDLMKRIRDLKKPFNVKALLKRKDKT